MNRISALALATIGGTTILGFALVGATFVSAHESSSRSQLALVVAKDPVRSASATVQGEPAKADGAEPQRTVRIVYVGPITAR